VKSLLRSLEAKLASIKDPEHSESDGDEENKDTQTKAISSKRAGKGIKRKKDSNADNDDTVSDEPSTVIYLGHLPVGFEEREITVFLNQFGNVKRCRVSRSIKTGRTRGYAFVEFSDEDVAKVVAETMSGYFLLEKRLVCHVLPNDKVHDLMFAKPKRVASKADRQKKARVEANKRRSADALKGITAKLVKREEMKRKKLASLGIDYNFPGYAGIAQPTDDSGESVKKKRKMSDGDAEEGGTNVNEAKALKSQKKKKKKPKKSIVVEKVEEKVEEKENDATKDVNEAATTAESSTKKKKRSKTPKKGKTPKKRERE